MLALVAVLLPAAVPALGEAPANVEAAASFFIETITVESERLSPEIVLSESLLRPDREYSEAELREAVHRINRLPFVLLAEFSLRKGSERGLYELVIQVYEARRWFSQMSFGVALNDPVDRFRFQEFSDRIRRFTNDDDFDALIGRRFAVGPRGLFFASFGSEAGLFAFGYQHYNLWDRNVLFSLTVAGENDFNTESRAARAQLSVPIRGNHALRLLGGWNRTTSDPGLFGEFELRETEVEVAWVFNSLDDPVLPRAGSLLEAGVVWSEFYDRTEYPGLLDNVIRQDFSESNQALIGSAARHWPLADRHSVSAGVRGYVGDGPVNGRLWEAEAIFGHQVFLLRNQEPGKWRELRLETELSGQREKIAAPPVSVPFFPSAVDVWRLSTGLTYRNGWGLFRLFVVHAERSLG